MFVEFENITVFLLWKHNDTTHRPQAFPVYQTQYLSGCTVSMTATCWPEQVWDDFPPSGQPGFPRGEGTFSATPLAWAHAQFVRLAWSIDAGRPVEQPSIVACRYTGRCTN